MRSCITVRTPPGKAHRGQEAGEEGPGGQSCPLRPAGETKLPQREAEPPAQSRLAEPQLTDKHSPIINTHVSSP